jgi:hypothetical protein
VPLSLEERQFLDAYVYEATHGPPFGGPATKKLAEKGISYSDLDWLLTAYGRELSSEGIPALGIQNLEPPPSPWETLEDVRLRNEVLKEELEMVR